SFENPLYAEEMNILDFLKQPDQTIIQALLLKFKPANMDVLPLYIILLLLFPPILWLLQRAATLALIGSAAVYVLVWWFNFNLPAFPGGVWYFTPFAGQLLFVLGGWCALGGAGRFGPFLRGRLTPAVALAYIAFAAFIALPWSLPFLNRLVHLPGWLEDLIYPIDKTNLDVLRFAHFLALAAVTVPVFPPNSRLFSSWALYPAIICRQHSFDI